MLPLCSETGTNCSAAWLMVPYDFAPEDDCCAGTIAGSGTATLAMSSSVIFSGLSFRPVIVLLRVRIRLRVRITSAAIRGLLPSIARNRFHGIARYWLHGQRIYRHRHNFNFREEIPSQQETQQKHSQMGKNVRGQAHEGIARRSFMCVCCSR